MRHPRFFAMLTIFLLAAFLSACGAENGELSETRQSEPSGVLLMDEVIDNIDIPEEASVFGSQTIKRGQISSITFLPEPGQVSEGSWDVSQAQDGSALAWAVKNGEQYDLYIAADGGVIAQEYCDDMFRGYANVKKIEFNSAFNTSGVISMFRMFRECRELVELDLTGFDTQNVTNMSEMFCLCESLVKLDVTGFDTSNATEMRAMFAACGSLTDLDVSSFDTSNVNYMNSMFGSCGRLKVLDVAGFDTANVKSMSEMFAHCPELTTIIASSSFTQRADTTGVLMFMDDTSLVGGAGTVYDETRSDKEYARIDNPPDAPGYFTLKTT